MQGSRSEVPPRRADSHRPGGSSPALDGAGRPCALRDALGEAWRVREARRFIRRLKARPPYASELYVQLEDLFVEVWKQEKFERTHPFTCGVIREAARVKVPVA